MTAQSLAQNAYRNAGATTRPPRHAEYEAIAKITHDIKKAMMLGQSGFPRLAEALHLNTRLWTILATEAADKDNGLPADTRARIFYLAEFTQQHSRKVLAGNATAAALLEVNTAILKGLRSDGVPT